ncbi:hypothetical protein XHV734_0804 [Xanthomonas hortorum pv. vitians]|nr:hypothetical protein XHV734_0804 [Xanthomonas hortorum pv. vitians]
MPTLHGWPIRRDVGAGSAQYAVRHALEESLRAAAACALPGYLQATGCRHAIGRLRCRFLP